jgi:hypothetical protein
MEASNRTRQRASRVTRGLLAAVVAAGCVGDHAGDGGTGAHERHYVTDGRCESCAIVLLDSLVLGARDDPVGSAGLPEVAVDASGRFYLASRHLHGGSVLRYEPDGSFSGFLGLRGPGPGEFELPWWVTASRAGEIFVYDRARYAVEVFGTDGTFLRTLSPVVPPADPPIIVDDTLLAVVSGRSRSQEAPDRPIQLYDARTGAVVGGTGPRSELRPDRPSLVRVISGSAASRIWILATRPEGPLELWTVAGEKRSELVWERPDQYWQDRLGSAFGRFSDTGSQSVGALWEDEDLGLIWTVHRLRDPDHVDPELEPGQPMFGFFDPLAMNSRYSSVVSVIDRPTAQVLAHFPTDRYLHGFLSDGRVIALGEDPDGFQWVSVWELAFRRR